MQSLKSQIAWCTRIQYLLGAMLLVVAAMFYFGGYRPESQKMRRVLADISDTKRQLEAGQDKARGIPGVARELADLKTKLRDFKKLPDNPELGEFMGQITQLSKASDLRKLEQNFPGGPRRSGEFTEMPVSLKFEGNFVNVFNFIRQVEDMPRLTRVCNIAIHGADLKTGTVQVEMSMNLYFTEG